MIKKNTGSYIFIQKKSHEKQQKTWLKYQNTYSISKIQNQNDPAIFTYPSG